MPSRIKLTYARVINDKYNYFNGNNRCFFGLLFILNFLSLKKLCKSCPQCGNKMKLKKKYKISNKGRFCHLDAWGVIKETILVPYCEHCKYEILPDEKDNDDSWKDANEL